MSDAATTGRPGDVVATAAEAAALSRPPLLVLEPLAAYLDRQGIGHGPVRAVAVGDGHSNATFVVAREGAEVVLRRPPRPPLPPSAHDVVREANVQRALAGRVRVPRILAIEADPAVLGAPFYLMERLDGDVVGPALPDAFADVADRAALGRELVDALVELHAVDPAEAGLDGFGRPSGYLERQVRRFGSLWADNRTRDSPALDGVTRWLAGNVPASGPPAVVHGDYRLGNAMFERPAGAPARLQAILDWELATLGDPLADVGYMSAMWAEPGDEETPMLALSAATRLPGFATRAELRERYAAATGRPLADLRWYEVLALWKSAIFLECSYARYRAGTTDDAYFATLGDGVPALVRAAEQRIAQR